jgi:hypothetical protein
MTTTEQINMIYSDTQGSLYVLKSGAVELSLNCEKRTRKLGHFGTPPNGVLSYYKHEKEKDVFRKTNAWSINWNVIQYLPSDSSMINIKSEGGIYRISKEKALKMGEFMFFKNAGIEKKIYVRKIFFDVDGL